MSACRFTIPTTTAIAILLLAAGCGSTLGVSMVQNARPIYRENPLTLPVVKEINLRSKSALELDFEIASENPEIRSGVYFGLILERARIENGKFDFKSEQALFGKAHPIRVELFTLSEPSAQTVPLKTDVWQEQKYLRVPVAADQALMITAGGPYYPDLEAKGQARDAPQFRHTSIAYPATELVPGRYRVRLKILEPLDLPIGMKAEFYVSYSRPVK